MTPTPSDDPVARVTALAQAAGLPMSPERAAALSPQLEEWLAAARELSTKMSAPEHREVAPITAFRQPFGSAGR